MDWIDWHFVTGMWAGVASVMLGGLLMLGWLRALRRSEPRSRFMSHQEMVEFLGAEAERRWEAQNPQPTSPPQSAPTTGLTPGQSARLSANLAFHLRKQAQPENED